MALPVLTFLYYLPIINTIIIIILNKLSVLFVTCTWFAFTVKTYAIRLNETSASVLVTNANHSPF